MTKQKWVFGLLISASVAMPGGAAEKKGVNMPDQITDQGHALVLNGLGIRKAYGMVSVYVAGLYVEKASHDSNAVIQSREQKRIVLHFLMDVDEARIRQAWVEGLTKNCVADCSTFAPEMKKLQEWTTSVHSGQEMAFAISTDSVAVSVAGAMKGTIQREGFPQQFVAMFLGPNPPNKGLKDGMLGLE